MLDFPQKFYDSMAKNFHRILSKCRVYREIGYENRSRLATTGKSTNR